MLLDGDIGLDGEEVVEGGALVVSELGVEAVGVEDGLALGFRHLAKVAEGAGDEAAAIDGQRVVLLRCGLNLLTLDGGEVLDGLVAGEEAAALLVRHVVELSEAIEEALLVLLGQLFEARLVLKGVLLLLRGEGAVTVHPLGEVLLILFGLAVGFGLRLRLAGWSGLTRYRRSVASLRCGMHGCEPDGPGEA
jgi:hypothetical protein